MQPPQQSLGEAPERAAASWAWLVAVWFVRVWEGWVGDVRWSELIVAKSGQEVPKKVPPKCRSLRGYMRRQAYKRLGLCCVIVLYAFRWKGVGVCGCCFDVNEGTRRAQSFFWSKLTHGRCCLFGRLPLRFYPSHSHHHTHTHRHITQCTASHALAGGPNCSPHLPFEVALATSLPPRSRHRTGHTPSLSFTSPPSPSRPRPRPSRPRPRPLHKHRH